MPKNDFTSTVVKNGNEPVAFENLAQAVMNCRANSMSNHNLLIFRPINHYLRFNIELHKMQTQNF